uniref:Cytochrome oxidase I n=1 Tax=Ceratovacuna sp. TaxID=41907 RepID=Q34246_9HEMI|nr:cytochrome oxidase I [Ceratovacuna sp.]
MWNMISSIGSMISTFSIILLIYSIWNSFFLKKMLIFKLNLNNFIEWIHNMPPLEHSYSELPMITK